MLATVVEAVVGAVWLDCGMDVSVIKTVLRGLGLGLDDSGVRGNGEGHGSG
jgi:hypothetical protein